MSYILQAQMKFWQHVQESLENVELSGAYFVGGTLSLPLGKHKGIALNLDGVGFVLNQELDNPRVYQPEPITNLVCEIYYKVKGETSYYQDEVKGRRLSYVEV